MRLGLNNRGGDFSCSSRSGGSGVRVSARPDISDPRIKYSSPIDIQSMTPDNIQSISVCRIFPPVFPPVYRRARNLNDRNLYRCVPQ